MIVTHKETLQFYDFDILFEAEDDRGRKYIAVNDGESETGLEYRLAPVEEQALTKFKEGQIDLGALMMAAPDGEWYRTTIGAETEEIELTRQEYPLTITDDMPESGYYLLRFNTGSEEPSSLPEVIKQPDQDSRWNDVEPTTPSRSRAMFKTNPVLLKILLDDVENGRIQLPDFQRGWVWEDDRIKDLLVSVANMFPIGAIMSLTAGGNMRFKTRPIEGVEIRPDDKPDTFLLDGQQRLTSLYQALRHPGPVNTRNNRNQPIRRRYYMDIMAALDPNANHDDMFVSMPENLVAMRVTPRGPETQDLSSPDLEYNNHMIPTERLMDPMKWALDYIRFWERSDDPHPAGDPFAFFEQFKRIIIDNFEKYQLPVIELDKDTSKEAVCTVFEKVNTGGVPLNVFELTTASFAAETETFSLREDWEERKERMYTSSGTLHNIQGDQFLQTINLLKTHADRKQTIAAGVPENLAPGVSNKKRDVLNLTLADYQNWADKAEQGFLQAARFLQTQYVFKQKDVPYTTQVIPLAALHVELGSELNSAIAKGRLEQWYWSGVFGEQYAGTTDTQIELDIQQVPKYIREGTLPNMVAQATFTPERLISLRSRNSAAYKGIYALLLKNGAADWMTGEPLGIVHFLDENIEIHHIFPIAWSKNAHIPSNLYNSIINRTPVDAFTNRSMGGQAPSNYLPRLRRKIAPENLEKVLETHLLNRELLEEDDFQSLFTQRGKEMLEMVSNAMGKDLGNADEALKEALSAAGPQPGFQHDTLLVEILNREQREEDQEYDELGEIAYEMAGTG